MNEADVFLLMLMQKNIEKMTRRAQEQFQMVLKKQSRLLNLLYDFSIFSFF